MDEERIDKGQDVQSIRGQDTSQGTRVSFPKTRRKKVNKKLIVVVAIVILVLVTAGYFMTREEEFVLSPEVTPTPTEQVSSTPTQEPVDKSEIGIEVLNGTGIAGEAAFLQNKLEGLEFEDIDVGNAAAEDYENTEVVFSSEVAEVVKNEVLDTLGDIYMKVESKSGELEEYDIQIIIGFRKDHTPTPTEEAESTTTPTQAATQSANFVLDPVL